MEDQQEKENFMAGKKRKVAELNASPEGNLITKEESGPAQAQILGIPGTCVAA